MNRRRKRTFSFKWVSTLAWCGYYSCVAALFWYIAITTSIDRVGKMNITLILARYRARNQYGVFWRFQLCFRGIIPGTDIHLKFFSSTTAGWGLMTPCWVGWWKEVFESILTILFSMISFTPLSDLVLVIVIREWVLCVSSLFCAQLFIFVKKKGSSPPIFWMIFVSSLLGIESCWRVCYCDKKRLR